MSYRAIACALALEDVSIGERLVAFSLASYANRAHQAWPAARTAATRAGMGRRQYLVSRDRLAERGLIELQESTGSVVARLTFAEDGPSIEREINAELFEAVLARSNARCGARALLAALAALAGADGIVGGVTTEELCEASGLSDRTYRRARAELLGADEVTLEQAGGGRRRQNVWRVSDPRTAAGGGAWAAPARQAPLPPRQLPLVAVVRDERVDTGGHAAGAGRQTLGNPGVNPGQNCTPTAPETLAETPAETPAQTLAETPAETPAQTPAETPASYVRAGWRESQNLGTAPPDPPERGQLHPVEITEFFTSARGRRRARRVQADPSELLPVSDTARRGWAAMRQRLREMVGASMFEIWLAPVEPIAVSRSDRALLLAAPIDAHAWVASRYRRVLDAVALESGRPVRMASDRELALHSALAAAPAARPPATSLIDDNDPREAI